MMVKRVLPMISLLTACAETPEVQVCADPPYDQQLARAVYVEPDDRFDWKPDAGLVLGYRDDVGLRFDTHQLSGGSALATSTAFFALPDDGRCLDRDLSGGWVFEDQRIGSGTMLIEDGLIYVRYTRDDGEEFEVDYQYYEL